MDKLIGTSRMPKPIILEVLVDYMEVENSIQDIIRATGYRHEYIAEKLKLPISTYYSKRRKKTFAPKELFKIVKMMDDDEMNNAEELALIEARKNDKDEYISGEEFLKQFRETMKQ